MDVASPRARHGGEIFTEKKLKQGRLMASFTQAREFTSSQVHTYRDGVMEWMHCSDEASLMNLQRQGAGYLLEISYSMYAN